MKDLVHSRNAQLNSRLSFPGAPGRDYRPPRANAVPGTIAPARDGLRAAHDINDFGAIVGSSGSDGFLLDANGLTALHVPGMQITTPTAINNKGHVAGNYTWCPQCLTADNYGGFVYDGTTYSLIRFPGAKETSG